MEWPGVGMRLFALFMLMHFIAINLAFSATEFEKAKVQTATHNGVKFTVTSQDYKVTYRPGDVSQGTRMFAKYETPKVDQLEEYGIVQFLRGCQYNTYLDKGKIVTVDNILRHSFNELVVFKHPDWIIDSVDLDPLYNNTPEGNESWGTRHGYYRWNRKNNYDEDGEVFFKDEKPSKNIKKPNLYILAHPGTSFIEAGWAKNVSMEFKTCLYKTKDIPQKTTAGDLHFAKAIQCFDWSTSFIYDHATSKIVRPTGLVPHCLK